MRNIKDPKHKLQVGEKAYGKLPGTCTCRKWAGVASSKRKLKQYHQDHVNVASNL